MTRVVARAYLSNRIPLVDKIAKFFANFFARLYLSDLLLILIGITLYIFRLRSTLIPLSLDPNASRDAGLLVAFVTTRISALSVPSPSMMSFASTSLSVSVSSSVEPDFPRVSASGTAKEEAE